jgi:hypothetical protein
VRLAEALRRAALAARAHNPEALGDALDDAADALDAASAPAPEEEHYAALTDMAAILGRLDEAGRPRHVDLGDVMLSDLERLARRSRAVSWVWASGTRCAWLEMRGPEHVSVITSEPGPDVLARAEDAPGALIPLAELRQS